MKNQTFVEKMKGNTSGHTKNQPKPKVPRQKATRKGF